ncbi:MAG: nucleoside deaminase [Xanthobacteraceae bacterium]|nr:nucleoside deaminase [Xanthobacteraceae bacterium]
MGDVALMRRAIELSSRSTKQNGGPFGAVVALEGRIIGEGVNQVVASRDPTAHAEICAIRMACAEIRSHQLTGCEIYTSCEPCPMCLSAIWWARIARIYYGNTQADAAAIGFDDNAFYRELSLPPSQRTVAAEQLCGHEAKVVFDEWFKNPQRILY